MKRKYNLETRGGNTALVKAVYKVKEWKLVKDYEDIWPTQGYWITEIEIRYRVSNLVRTYIPKAVFDFNLINSYMGSLIDKTGQYKVDWDSDMLSNYEAYLKIKCYEAIK